jgi:hypothetical protein
MGMYNYRKGKNERANIIVENKVEICAIGCRRVNINK